MRELLKFGIFTFVFFHICLLANSQSYKTKDIKAKADSILKSTLGENIFEKYYKYDTDSYYEYVKRNGKHGWENLTKYPKTSHSFVSVNVRYTFCLDIYNHPCVFSSIQFDKNLNQIGKFNVEYVPEYIVDRKPCNILSDTTVLAIGAKIFKEKGIKAVSARLEYDYQSHRYLWNLENILTENKDSSKNIYSKMELLTLNAFTGEIINFSPEAVYGPLY